MNQIFNPIKNPENKYAFDLLKVLDKSIITKIESIELTAGKYLAIFS